LSLSEFGISELNETTISDLIYIEITFKTLFEPAHDEDNRKRALEEASVGSEYPELVRWEVKNFTNYQLIL